MKKEIEPNIQNRDILKQYLEIKVSKAMKERFPTAKDVVEDVKSNNI